MDTTVFEDGVNLFKIKVIERDPAKKSGITNLSLILDNYGPFVIINQPESNSPSQPIQNRFNCAILPLDYELNKVTNVEWRIQSLEDENNFLEGNKSFEDNPKDSNASLSFQIDPNPILQKEWYKPGFYELQVRGQNQDGKFSKDWATINVYIDFGGAIPVISLSTPTSKDINNPTNTGSSMTITGIAMDDEEVAEVELEWG